MINTDPNHKHIYDKQGNMTCCTLEEKVYEKAGAKKLLGKQHHEDHDHEGHDHSHKGSFGWNEYLPVLVSLMILFTGIVMDNYLNVDFFSGYIRLTWYILAYLPVAIPVIKEAFKGIIKKEFFTEFTLMTIATIGAFAIKEYPEGVAVMVFYAIGELFQSGAVKRAKGSIKSLLDQRPDEVTVWDNGNTTLKKAEEVSIGEIIQLRPGDKLALDGELISDQTAFNTAALTGESKPDTKKKGDIVLAGMINLNSVSLVKVNTVYADSKLSKILHLIENASAQKATTELFIRKFSKYYTPVVVALAVLICALPYFVTKNYVFSEWLYRSLIFLVISCPCALVISIPLGYFGGIGAGSRNGILFKGGNFLDIMASIKNVVMDKTGTLTKGVFKVQEVKINEKYNKEEILQLVNLLESKSSHPVATAIHEYVGKINASITLSDVEEVPGHGLKAYSNGVEILVGNFKLMDKFGVSYDLDPKSIVYTVIAIALNKKFVGYITIADEIKEDAKLAIQQLHSMNIQVTMLSGDKTSVVKYVASQLNIDNAFGDLLPEDKVNIVKEIKDRKETIAFAGDGVNDAPVVALSDAGIAMGGLGSDATIETADIVIQNDEPTKIPIAINIGKATKKIVWQNIILAFTVKAIVLILGAGGLATMWEAVFADVGVALVAILNAVRIQKMSFRL